MAETSIEWTDTTWNPLAGCDKISPGCAHCYAETMAKRLKAMAEADIAAGKNPGAKRHYLEVIDNKGRWNGKIATIEEKLTEPLTWKKPRRVFVNSMSDLFHNDVPDDFIDRVFAVMALTDHCTFQVLTKRADRMARYFGADGLQDRVYEAMEREAAAADIADFLFDAWPLPNVWLGVSVENQKAADERIPLLLQTPTAVRFLSCEPLLGPVDLEKVKITVSPGNFGNPFHAYHRPGTPQQIASLPTWKAVDWVIVGGESGYGARGCHIEWIRDIVFQCKEGGVPVFVKQLGANAHHQTFVDDVPHNPRMALKSAKGGDMEEWPSDLRVREFPA